MESGNEEKKDGGKPEREWCWYGENCTRGDRCKYRHNYSDLVQEQQNEEDQSMQKSEIESENDESEDNESEEVDCIEKQSNTEDDAYPRRSRRKRKETEKIKENKGNKE